MARPGITRWRSSNSPPTEGSDEVQRSLELLDQVLSEFDDLENGNVAAREVRAQLSEDDGYMSMNGRRAKFVLNFRPPPPDGDELPPTPEPCGPPPPELADFPPPPEEAERIISTLLPKVSPGNSAKRAPGSVVRHGAGKVSSFTLGPHFGSHDSRVTTATQTTLPKTRHQRPFGWENGHTSHPHLPSHKFGSLPYDNSHQWLSHGPVPLPPRTCPTVVDRHREVRRRTPEEENGEAPMKTLSETTDDDHANFSDDSLEELLPPPPPTSKRSSIAWEVPLDLDEEALLTPGSTKVVGRRRRKSTDRSSTGSTSRLRDQEDWPDPPTGTEDGSISPFSDWDSSAGKLDDGSFLPPELSASDLSASGTYVIRKGRRKERTPVSPTNKKPEKLKQSPSPNSNSKLNELKRCSSTFDNIKSLLKEGLIEGLDETPPDFQPPTPPALVRVVSLPTLTIDETCQTEPLQIVEERVTEPPKPTEEVKTVESKSVEVEVKSCDVGIQVMDDLPLLNSSEKHKESVEESTQVSLEYRDVNDDKSTELSKSCDSVVDSIDSRTEEALILKLQQDQSEDFSSSEDILSPSFTSCAKQVNSFEVAKQEIISDPWLTAAEISEVQVIPVVEEKSKVLEVNGVKEEEEKCEKPPGDFNVMVEVLQHEFGPLPPSPVEEDEDEYNDVLRNSPVRTSRGKADSVPEPFYRCLEPPGSDPIGAKFLNRPCPDPPPHKEPTSSLKTRSMDAGFSRNHKNQHSNSRRDIPSERRTLPSELPGPSRRRTFQKRGSSQSPREEGHMQVSCSLPETPIFARGCDIPRTPHRRAPEIPPAGTRTTPRPPGIQTSSYRRTPTTVGHGTTGSTTTLGQAMVGAELLRLTGGPGRGWYPRHRNPRPASVEHLDHLAHPTAPAHGWDASQSRKPLTLPPNLTPKFFHRSPREALRRVTSLLIRKDEATTAPPVPPHNSSLLRGKQGNSKDSKKDQLSPTQAFGANGEEGTRQKRGFFKSFWKRSRHYSLEQQ